MLIAVDVDSTLYDSDPLFSRVASSLGMGWPTRAMYWFKATDLGFTLGEVKNLFRLAHSRDWVMTTVPYPGAVDTLTEVAERFDVDIVYVSDRHAQSMSALEDWLSEHGFLAHGQYVVCSKDKREWLRVHRPEIVIDDRVRTIAMARYELGSRCFAIRHNHNCNLINEIDGVWICDDWHVLRNELIREMGAELGDKRQSAAISGS